MIYSDSGARRSCVRAMRSGAVAACVFALFSGCATGSAEARERAEAERLVREQRYGKGRVSISADGGSYSLAVDGDAFYVKGVGLGPNTGYPPGMSDELKRGIDLAAEAGANAIRTWSHESAREILDYCQSKNMMACVGLWVQHERHGFDYGDPLAVEAQKESFRKAVEELKDHPALLLWGVGNEVETEARDMRVWDAIDDISRMIHGIDGNHPTMYVVADYFDPVVADISLRLGDIDIIGVNSYANLGACLERWDESAERRPIIVTEWGPRGWWESPAASWGAPVESVSGVRREEYWNGYGYIASRPGRVLGSFAFYWGQKQERTHTWFSLALDGGILTEAADSLSLRWNGKPPANSAPNLTSVRMNGMLPESSAIFAPGSSVEAEIAVSDADGDALVSAWTVREETTATSIGGDAESVPRAVPVEIESSSVSRFSFRAPGQSGAYRLFVQTEDGRGKAATANFPFYVK